MVVHLINGIFPIFKPFFLICKIACYQNLRWKQIMCPVFLSPNVDNTFLSFLLCASVDLLYLFVNVGLKCLKNRLLPVLVFLIPGAFSIDKRVVSCCVRGKLVYCQIFKGWKQIMSSSVSLLLVLFVTT